MSGGGARIGAVDRFYDHISACVSVTPPTFGGDCEAKEWPASGGGDGGGGGASREFFVTDATCKIARLRWKVGMQQK